MSIILLRFAFIWKFFESMCSYPTTGLDKTFIMKTYFNIYFLATSKRQLFTQTDWVWDTSNNPNQCHSKKCSGKNLFAIIQFKTIICFTTSKLAISWAGQEKVKMRARTSQATLLNFWTQRRSGTPSTVIVYTSSFPTSSRIDWGKILDFGGSKC